MAYKEFCDMPDLSLRCFINPPEGAETIAVGPHWHEAIELLYVEEGSAVQQLDEGTFPIRAGDFVVIWKNQIHSTYSDKGRKCVIRVLQFMVEDPERDGLRFVGPVTPQESAYVAFRELTERIVQEAEQQPEGYQLAAKGLMLQLYTAIVRAAKLLPVRWDKSGVNKKTAAALLHYITAHYTAPITLRDVAEGVHLSVPQVSRDMKRATGMTFKQYLDLYRLNHACGLLGQGESVANTAMRCGYGSVSAFVRTFRRYRGVAPSEFRKKSLDS